MKLPLLAALLLGCSGPAAIEPEPAGDSGSVVDVSEPPPADASAPDALPALDSGVTASPDADAGLTVGSAPDAGEDAWIAVGSDDASAGEDAARADTGVALPAGCFVFASGTAECITPVLCLPGVTPPGCTLISANGLPVWCCN